MLQNKHIYTVETNKQTNKQKNGNKTNCAFESMIVLNTRWKPSIPTIGFQRRFAMLQVFYIVQFTMGYAIIALKLNTY